jgi:hypothetical protein
MGLLLRFWWDLQIVVDVVASIAVIVQGLMMIMLLLLIRYLEIGYLIVLIEC